MKETKIQIPTLEIDVQSIEKFRDSQPNILMKLQSATRFKGNTLIKKCNSFIETEGVDSENYKSSIHDLDVFLNTKINKNNLTCCKNFEEVRNYVKNLIESLKSENTVQA